MIYISQITANVNWLSDSSTAYDRCFITVLIATASIAYSSSRNIVYRVLDGASFRNSDSGGDVLIASVAAASGSVSVSTSGSFGICPAGTAAESSDAGGTSVFCSYVNIINHYIEKTAYSLSNVV